MRRREPMGLDNFLGPRIIAQTQVSNLARHGIIQAIGRAEDLTPLKLRNQIIEQLLPPSPLMASPSRVALHRVSGKC